MEKITKRNVYTALINFANTGVMSFDTEDGEVTVGMDALKAFAENEINLLDKRAETAKKSAAKRKTEVNPLREKVHAVLGAEFEPIADITARVEDEDATVSKVVYQLNQLVEAGVAEKQPIKVSGGEGKKTRTVQGYRLVQEVAETDAE